MCCCIFVFCCLAQESYLTLSKLLTDITPNSPWTESVLLSAFWGEPDPCVPHRSSNDHGGKDISISPRAFIQLGGWKAVISSVLCVNVRQAVTGEAIWELGRYCWPKHSWRCPWLGLVFVPGERRHSGGRWSVECRLTERGGLFRSSNYQLLGGGCTYVCGSGCVRMHSSLCQPMFLHVFVHISLFVSTQTTEL